jgi:hypothetical protein
MMIADVLAADDLAANVSLQDGLGLAENGRDVCGILRLLGHKAFAPSHPTRSRDPPGHPIQDQLGKSA